jgi:CubicO group peptidase (beta-lactamase class C family)
VVKGRQTAPKNGLLVSVKICHPYGCLTLLFVLFLSLHAFAAPGASEVDEIFSHWAGNRPGGAVGVVFKDRLFLSKGYGMSNLAEKTPNTPQTVYDLASVSKQFAATVVLVQAEKGKLKLDAGLGTYLAGLPRYAAETPLKNLLNMTSGLPDYDDDEETECEDLVAQLNGEEPSFKAGARYEYLNMNYALLTYVVENVTGKSMAQMLDTVIFQPLRMNHTVFLDEVDQKIPNRAVGYAMRGDGWVRSVGDDPGVADGNVFSSVDDLSLWARDLLRGSSILSAEWQARAWTSGSASGESTGYGYGFEVDTHEGHTRISHDGSWYGTATYMSMYPKLQLAVIVLANREDEDCSELGEQVEDLYLP